MLVEFDRFEGRPRDSEIPRPITVDAYRDLLGDVQLHTGLARRGEAECVVQAVVALLGEAMADGDRLAVVPMLPQPIAQALQSRPGGHDHGADAVYRLVASSLGIGLSPALEYTQAVCQGMSRTLERGAIRALRSRLPEALAALFADRVERSAPPRRPSRPPRPENVQNSQTLAAGRPGSRHPLSEAGVERRDREAAPVEGEARPGPVAPEVTF